MLREGGRFLRIELQGYSDCSGNKKMYTGDFVAHCISKQYLGAHTI